MPCRHRDCELDHCASCGGHDHEDAPCAEMLVEKKHAEWERALKLEAFESWKARQKGAITFEDAFVAGTTFHEWAPPEYMYGNCGQNKCRECHAPDDDVVRAERAAGWDPNP